MDESGPRAECNASGKRDVAARTRKRAENRKAAQEAIERFEDDYGAKYPKAVGSLRRDQDLLLAFFDFPAEHWMHLRTGNVIESPFATVRLRQRVTKGAGSRLKGLLMAFKLLAMAERRWRRINAPHLVALVRAGGVFRDGLPLSDGLEVSPVGHTVMPKPSLVRLALSTSINPSCSLASSTMRAAMVL